MVEVFIVAALIVGGVILREWLEDRREKRWLYKHWTTLAAAGDLDAISYCQHRGWLYTVDDQYDTAPLPRLAEFSQAHWSDRR